MSEENKPNEDDLAHYESGCRGYKGRYVFNMHPLHAGDDVNCVPVCMSCGRKMKEKQT